MVDQRREIQNAATVGGFRLAALAARALPAFAAQGLSPALGFGASFANAERREMIERHLRRADPTMGGARLRRAVQLAFDSYTRYWLESFRLPHLPRRTVDRGMRVDGYDHVEAGLAGGKGVILALPHLGGWEWAGRWLVDRGLGVTAVVEAIEPPELFDWFKQLRSELGMNIVALGPSAGKEVLAALQRNDVVCLLSDRDIQRTGIEVEFFGETTTLPAGPATLALRTGAPLLPTAVYFTDRTDGHLGIVRPPIDTTRFGERLRVDIARVTQDLAAELEHLIRRAPYQWHLFQPNWPSDPGYDPGAGK
ncbi:MAG: phosphatidylinositol mannoside acyltransferase [Acidimicrobiaceae bacterium]|nr:phosphatidylinositol mannoside acyltransferase [Acidimicrobiaceae bacterium]